MRIATIFLTYFLLALPVAAQETPRTITVTGRGEVAVAPDMATVSLGVETTDATARGAMEANSTAMAAVIEAIRGTGIAARDIQTSSLNLSPRWQRNRNTPDAEPKITGYTASNLLTIRVRDLAGVGQVLDEVTRLGVNRINSISFGLQNSSEPLDQARVLAVKEAMRKAALYAEAAGVTLGDVLSIDDTAGGTPQPRALGAARMEMAASVPVEAGELSLTAQVRIVLQIE